MKKIGLITINDYNNYGNRLQNYALQTVLINIGFDVITVKNIPKFETKYERFKKNSVNDILKKVKQKLLPSDYTKSQKIRNNTFRKFTENNIKETAYTIYDGNLSIEELNQFDYFVAGSDQIWNSNFRYGSSVDFLIFAPEEKRVTYAASFGIDSIPKEFKDNYKKWLSAIPNISVREKAGAHIVKDLIGKEVPVVADPTMLLSKNDWLTIAKPARNRPTKSYILTYFLGGPSEDVRGYLKKLSVENNMEIINLGDITEKDTYQTGPSEFIDYINNASAFFTDSFHGVVFSILFQTPFLVYERNTSQGSMYSRIETILEMFDMKHREAKQFEGNVFSMDFSESLKVLEKEYETSINYLKKALRIEE